MPSASKFLRARYPSRALRQAWPAKIWGRHRSITLRPIYRLDVSKQCAAESSETCVVALAPQCPVGNADCLAFIAATDAHFAVASRLLVEHKVGQGLLARNIDSTLQNAVWQIPPHLRTVLAKLEHQDSMTKAPGTDIKRYSLVYLPIAMGSRTQTISGSNPPRLRIPTST